MRKVSDSGRGFRASAPSAGSNDVFLSYTVRVSTTNGYFPYREEYAVSACSMVSYNPNIVGPLPLINAASAPVASNSFLISANCGMESKVTLSI